MTVAMSTDIRRPMRLAVSDVMTRYAITVAPDAGFQEIERLLAQHHVGALPVVDVEGRPVGVVSETDLVLKTEAGLGAPAGIGSRARHQRAKAAATTAQGLMTAPPISIAPGERLAAAARLMRQHAVNQLLVVGGGRLLGVVSRGDLLKSFLRADEDIRDDVVQGVIDGIMWLNPVEFEVSVNDGVVNISGVIERRSHVEILFDLIRGVEGVVAVRPAVGYRLDDRNLAISAGVPPY
jgi:CBS domain-containing protein